jgi:hypothetical protein
MEPVDVFVNKTVSGALPLVGEAEKFATGAPAGPTTMKSVLVSVSVPTDQVTVRLGV